MGNLSAIILAAGDSKRMGMPKALLEIGGKYFIEHVLENLRLAGVSDRIVVLGKDSRQILSSWKPKSEKVAINPEPDLGQISSLRVGIEAVENSADAYMVCLVDMPAIKPETYKQIINLWKKNKDCIVIPKCFNSQLSTLNSQLQFKRGHPIIIPAIYRHLCFEGPIEKGLHWVTHHSGVKVLDLKVDDKNILTDIDTQKDYKILNSAKNKK